MFLHIGENYVIPVSEIVGIFDISTFDYKSTKEFLQIAEEEGFIINTKEKEEKAFILTTQNVYFSSISSTTLNKRLENIYHLEEVEGEDMIADYNDKDN